MGNFEEELRKRQRDKLRQDAADASTQVKVSPIRPARTPDYTGEELRKAYSEPIKYFADLVSRRKKEYDEAKAEEDARVKAAGKAAKWTAGAEAAAALANLIGVAGYGASNQTVPDYSRQWMQTAAQSNQQRRERLDRARALQASADEGLANARMRRGVALSQWGQQKEQTAYERRMREDAVRRQDEATEYKRRQDEAAREWQREQFAEKLRQQAYKNTIDAAVAESTINRNNAAAQKGGRDAGSSSTSSRPFSISFYGTGAEGANETLNFKDKSQLVNIVKANQNADGIWEGLSADEEKKVRDILSGRDISVLNGGSSADNVADRLVPYVRKSPKMMSLLREATGAEKPKTKKTIDLSGKY